MAIAALGATATPSYAAVDKAKADQGKAAALLAEHQQCKACSSTIAKDQKAVDEATAITHAATVKIEAAMAASRGGINIVV